jgi:pyridoxal biosynthesis lyase PdxS
MGSCTQSGWDWEDCPYCSGVCHKEETMCDNCKRIENGDAIRETKNEIGTWEFLAEGLNQNHQQSVKNQILSFVAAKKEQLKSSSKTKERIHGKRD